jgi:hypothetical protein
VNRRPGPTHRQPWHHTEQEKRLRRCDCLASDDCPQGRVGFEERCSIRVDEPDLMTANETLRERVFQLEELLTGGVGFRAPVEWGLTRSEERVLGVLVAREVATNDALVTILYGGRDAYPGAPEAMVKLYVMRLRRKLPAGSRIATLWGRGYSLDAATRAMLTAPPERGRMTGT